MSQVDDIFERARSLSRDERAHLTRRLAESLDAEIHDDAEEAWRKEIAARVAALDAGTVETRPADEVMARVREKLLKLRRD